MIVAVHRHLAADQECEPAVGRLLVFSVEGQGAERKVDLAAEVETRGAVYVLNGFNGKLLACINSKVMPCYRYLAFCLTIVKRDGLPKLACPRQSTVDSCDFCWQPTPPCRGSQAQHTRPHLLPTIFLQACDS